MDPALNAGSLEQHRMLARLIGRGPEVKAVALLKRHIAKTLDDYERTLGPEAPSEPASRTAGDAMRGS